MSLHSGLAEHRYITILHHPAPGYCVTISHPDKVHLPVSRIFAGYAHSLDAYLAAALKWRDDTYAKLHHKPLRTQASRTVGPGQGTGNAKSRRAERRLIRLLRVTPARRRGLFIDATALIERMTGNSPGRHMPTRRHFSFKDYCEKKLPVTRAPHGVAVGDLASGTLSKQGAVATAHHPAQAGKHDPRAEVDRAEGPCSMQCVACAAKQAVFPPLSAAGQRLSREADYDPGRLIAFLVKNMHLESDRALARLIDISPATLSKIRNRKLPVGASFLIRSHEASDIPVKALRLLMGDRRKLPR